MLAGCVAQDPQSFAKGKALFQSGLLSEAVLALEAEVQRRPDNVEAWRLLGTVHAENDDDQQVIACAAGRVISERERCLNATGVLTVGQLCWNAGNCSPEQGAGGRSAQCRGAAFTGSLLHK